MTPLFMTADAVGGVFQYARGLAGHGVETTLAVLGPAMSAGQRAAAERIEGSTLIETSLPLHWLAADEAGVVATAARFHVAPLPAGRPAQRQR